MVVAGMRALRPCREPGCPRYAMPGASSCSVHLPARPAKKDNAKAHHRLYTNKRLWVNPRRSFLADHPLCAVCQAEGRLVGATIVDHIIPHKGDLTLFSDQTNWQPLCKRCHDQKTAREDGGFGNKQADQPAGDRPGGEFMRSLY